MHLRHFDNSLKVDANFREMYFRNDSRSMGPFQGKPCTSPWTGCNNDSKRISSFTKINRCIVAKGERGRNMGRKGSSHARKDDLMRKKQQPCLKKNGGDNKQLSMTTIRADETLLFQSVPAVENAIKVVYAYPNEYTVGITSLGYQLVWAFLETHELCSVSRLFTDVSDQVPQKIDMVGFSFSWELDYVHVVNMLSGLEVPTFADDRTEEHPIVFGGGPVLTANPEPFAGFFDVILLGDGEEILDRFVQVMYSMKNDASSLGLQNSAGRRLEMLEVLSQIPGIYVPQFYEPKYDIHSSDIVDIVKKNPMAPDIVQKQTYRGDTLAASTIVSPRMAWENIFMVETVRSCPEMCRFCLASYLTLPFRPAALESSLIPTIEKGLEVTDRIGLLGASVTQHPEFDQLLEWLMKPERKHMRLSIASVRTNTVTQDLAEALSSRGTKSLTIAVESGSPRIRRIVNKKLEQEDIEKAAVNAQMGGLQSLKLYGMVGIPGESDDIESNADINATIAMMKSLKQAAPRLKLTLGCSTFVPKAHTPFQWCGVQKAADKKLKYLEKELRKDGVQFRPESYKWSVVQALLSRGDRRLTPMLLEANDLGGSLSTFKRAAKEIPDLPPLEYYSHKDYDTQKLLPWSHLRGPLPVETLRKHYQESLEILHEGEESCM